MGIRVWRSDGRTCAEASTGDYTLCGAAWEGDESNSLAPVVYTRERGPITCPGCCEVIRTIRCDYLGARLEPIRTE